MEIRVKEPCYVGVRMHQESGRGVRNMEKSAPGSRRIKSLNHIAYKGWEKAKGEEEWETWVGTTLIL